MMDTPLLSICIPSYNRPEELYRLLKSIDIKANDKVEIVICEDYAPRREEVRQQVNKFKLESNYKICYHENEKLGGGGYDRNLRQCIRQASGKWIMFMGDDDMFVSDTMDDYLLFLEKHPQLGYVLRSYQAIHMDGQVEQFKYYEDTRFFEPGFQAYVELFRKSVFVSGFACQRKYAVESLTDRFDGSLLYQLYIMAEICMVHPSAYYGIPITQSIDGGIPYFGSSDAEKDLYTPGTVTVDNSINFMKNFFVITSFLDQKYKIHSTEYIQRDISKYAYPVLSIQRKKGRKVFFQYHRRLKELGIAITLYYYIYFVALFLFNEKICDGIIRGLKKILGKTPKL